MTDATEDREAGWEYLLLAHALRDAINSHDSEYNDYRLGFAKPTGQRIRNVVDVAPDASARLDETRTAVSNINRLFAPASIEAAIGKPGESGDAELIRQLGTRIADVYASLLAWGASVRGAEVPNEARSVYDALALLVATPIEEIRAFATKLVIDVENVIEDVRVGRPQQIALVAELKLTVDEEAEKHFDDSLKAFKNTVTGAGSSG